MNNKVDIMNNKADILFPAFVSLFINDTNNTCIYYFRGLTTDNKYAYQLFNEEDLPPYKKYVKDDGAVIYEFTNKINKIQCNLVSNFENIPNKKINLSII